MGEAIRCQLPPPNVGRKGEARALARSSNDPPPKQTRIEDLLISHQKSISAFSDGQEEDGHWRLKRIRSQDDGLCSIEDLKLLA